MKKRTKKLIEGISSYISECYPFLDESEKNEILENFIYRALKESLAGDIMDAQQKHILRKDNAISRVNKDRAVLKHVFDKENPDKVAKDDLDKIYNRLSYIYDKKVLPKMSMVDRMRLPKDKYIGRWLLSSPYMTYPGIYQYAMNLIGVNDKDSPYKKFKIKPW